MWTASESLIPLHSWTFLLLTADRERLLACRTGRHVRAGDDLFAHFPCNLAQGRLTTAGGFSARFFEFGLRACPERRLGLDRLLAEFGGLLAQYDRFLRGCGRSRDGFRRGWRGRRGRRGGGRRRCTARRRRRGLRLSARRRGSRRGSGRRRLAAGC